MTLALDQPRPSPDALAWRLAPRQRWRLLDAPAPDARTAALLSDLHPVLARVLGGRNLADAVDVRNYLACAYPQDNPFRMAGLTDAVTRIRRALASGELIGLYGDYDADGVTAVSVLRLTLEAMGGRVRPFVPHRERDGYGVHEAALAKLAVEGVSLLITVDCGIRSAAELDPAQAGGMDIIVTDHHALPKDLPQALAVLNPRRPDCRYGFQDLAGVGLAYKLAQGLLRVAHQAGEAPPLDEGDLLDLVALGTVADVVPLVGENRALVARGLERLRRGPRPGLAALLSTMGQESRSLSARDLAFGIGPRLNAAGRMDDADLALDLLAATRVDDALPLAARLESRNRARRAALDLALAEAGRRGAERGDRPYLVVDASPDTPLGVVGLVAGRLCEQHYRPSLCVRVDDATARGSARSIPEFDITAALDDCADLLVRHGGHARAAGFTVLTERLPELESRLEGLARAALSELDLRAELAIAAQLRPPEVDLRLAEALQGMEPFGEGNARPLFWLADLPVLQARAVGDGKHLRLLLDLGHGRDRLEAIAFGRGDDARRVGSSVDVVGSLEVGEWQGRRKLEMKVADLGVRA